MCHLGGWEIVESHCLRQVPSVDNSLVDVPLIYSAGVEVDPVNAVAQSRRRDGCEGVLGLPGSLPVQLLEPAAIQIRGDVEADLHIR